MLNIIAAEFKKIATLPASLIAAAISVLGTLGFAALAANSLRTALDTGNTGSLIDTTTIDAGLDLVPLGTIGAIVLGVVIVSSEYTSNSNDAGGGRQILTSLTGTPRRGVLLTAKALVLTVTTGLLAAVTIPATILLSQALLGEHGHRLDEIVDEVGWRAVGAVAYWVLTALIAFAITVFTRSGIIPLSILIANSSLVSGTLLLTRVTPLAKYLPDVAGAQMITNDYPAENMLDPLAGGLVMAAWTVGLLAVAAAVFARRDA
jgi:ABC-type transport system involved in multi-copper enzyme maturation permease subunit